jgi:hypothetical protein
LISESIVIDSCCYFGDYAGIMAATTTGKMAMATAGDAEEDVVASTAREQCRGGGGASQVQENERWGRPLESESPQDDMIQVSPNHSSLSSTFKLLVVVAH